MESYKLTSFLKHFCVVAENQAGLISWTHGLCSHTGLWAQKGSIVGLMLCCQYPEVHPFFLSFFFFCLFRAAPTALEGSQARGQIGAIAAHL